MLDLDDISWLGLEPDRSVRVLAEGAAPQTVAQGYARTAAPSTVSDIEASLRDLDLASANIGVDDIDVCWWLGRHGVLVVEAEGEVLAKQGDIVELSDGRLVLGLHGAVACARIRTANDDLVVAASEGLVRVSGIDAPPPAWLVSQPSLEQPRVVRPPLATFGAYAVASAWARAEAERAWAREHDLWSTAITVGLLARFHTPANRDEPHAESEQLLAWCRDLEVAMRDQLESEAIDEALSLSEAVERLPVTRDEVRRLHARAIVRRRDELACVEWVLLAAGADDTASEALAALDDEAESRLGWMTAWFRDDERLSEVSWREPEAWWGALAVVS